MRDVVLLFVHALNDRCASCSPGRRTFYPGRIRFSQASIVGFKSFSTAGAQPSAGRPIDRLIIVVPRRLARCAIVVKPPTFVKSPLSRRGYWLGGGSVPLTTQSTRAV